MRLANSWMSILAAMAVCGCGSSQQRNFVSRSASPSSVASKAMEQCDANGDGKLDATELETCLSLRDSLASYDTDGDGAISEEELLSQLETLLQNGVKLTNVSCTVINGRSAVPNARVTFEPAPFMADVLESASGTTDSAGVAMIAVSDEELPDDLKGKPVMHLGLYDVTVEGGNTTAKFGHEVNPLSRTGVNPTFDLKSAR